MNMKKLPVIVCLILLFSAEQHARSDDWPMWRYDSGRTAASNTDLPDKLQLLWTRDYGQREMVWDDALNQDLMPYDRIFEPVVAGKTMFVGFNDSDKVVALDTESGRELWTFYTDGPVRFSPVAWKERVYFTSDDGYLYCVNAGDGTLVWKLRGGPTDSKILGNKRLISTWPARGGAVIEDGVVYFAASIWPFMGIFIYAVDAATGEIIWKNDGHGSTYMKQPHNTADSFAGVAPQGALVVSGDKLLIPGGRSVPACFNRHTGEFLYYDMRTNSKTGGSFVAAHGGVFFNHHRERVTSMYDIETGNPLIRGIGKYPVLTDETRYFSGTSVAAFDVELYPGKLGSLLKNIKDSSELTKQLIAKLKEKLLWSVDVDATGDLIKAGDRLYAAGGSKITALSLGSKFVEPKIEMAITVEGTVERLIAADGKLFAVTLEGKILAYGEEKTVPLQIHTISSARFSKKKTSEARDILIQTGVRDGYALFYGIGNGDLLEALAENSKLHIVAVDPDGRKVESMRRRFDKNGLYGTRISVLEGDPLTVRLPQYMASLTIVHDLDMPKKDLEGEFLNAVYAPMRPYGGIAILPLRGRARTRFIKTADNSGLHGLTTVKSRSSLLILREGPLKGSDVWTHNYGDIANTAKSDDELVKLPLGVLWFGGNSNEDVLPRHGHGPTEQVVGGKLYIEGMDCISARDVYTGRVIWKTELKNLGTFGVYYDETYEDTPTSTKYNQVHIPGANIRGTNYIATSDLIYVIQGSRCIVLDADTGNRMDVIELPESDSASTGTSRPEWGYIGVYEDYIIAGYEFVLFSDLAEKSRDFDKSAGKRLAVMDRYSGKVLWKTKADYAFLTNGIASGKGVLYCLDKLPPYVESQLIRRGKAAPDSYRLLALDMATGKILWEKNDGVFGSFLNYSGEHDLLVQSTRPSRDTVAGESGKRIAVYNGSDGTVVWDKDIEYGTFPVIHNENIITESGMLSLLSGDTVNRRDPLTGEEIPFSWKRSYGCNYPVASENLLTFRSGAAGFFDITNFGGTGNFGGIKSGCTASLVAADGVLNAPDYTRTCSCAYQNQTSLALVHMPDVEIWTFNPIEWSGKALRRVGLNFGAPGDRLSDSGTLWLDYPSVGGESPDIPVSAEPEDPETYRAHSSHINSREYNWVASSGVKNLKELEITLAEEETVPRTYTVRLYFAEPDNFGAGGRVFDIGIQGKTVLEDFDIVKTAGAANTLTVKEFKGIKADRTLTMTFGREDAPIAEIPVISGIEIIAQGW
ncbi:PQQ-binding-like beta-propeller repeat protein [Candidatus Latescibacterota bacterium]